MRTRDHEAQAGHGHGVARCRDGAVRRAGVRSDLDTRDLCAGRADQGRLLLQLRQQGRPVPRTARPQLGAEGASGSAGPCPPAAQPAGAARQAPTRGCRDLAVDRQWTLVSVEFSLHAIRRPDVAQLLVEHERRVRSELAVLVTEALEAGGTASPPFPWTSWPAWSLRSPKAATSRH